MRDPGEGRQPACRGDDDDEESQVIGRERKGGRGGALLLLCTKCLGRAKRLLWLASAVPEPAGGGVAERLKCVGASDGGWEWSGRVPCAWLEGPREPFTRAFGGGARCWRYSSAGWEKS